jgi:hypothetical protein
MLVFEHFDSSVEDCLEEDKDWGRIIRLQAKRYKNLN